MKNDLHLTFAQIFSNDPAALLAQLRDIEVHHKADRQASEKWAERLRFIDISGVPDLRSRRDTRSVLYKELDEWTRTGTTPPCILSLSEKEDDDGQLPYVAVSWRWIQGDELPPWGCDIRESFQYQVQRPGCEPHEIDFPQHYLDRVILFAQNRGIDKIWIDKESIYQRSGDEVDHPGDRDLGIQVMDAVYGDARYCVGLLTTSLMYQDELHLLADLLSRNIFVNPRDTEEPQFTADAPVADIQLLILRLLNDTRWSRGWIFQEDHLASERMTLLVPHSRHLKKKGLSYPFGKLPGDLEVALFSFRRAVTMFCMASDESENRWPISEMLGKAKQYNIWNKVLHVEGDSSEEDSDDPQSDDDQYEGDATRRFQPPRFPTTTLSIIDDVCNRSLKNMEDRVAIIANAAKFERRIDVSPSSALVRNETYSLSTILLALVLLNGEILSHDTKVPGNIMNYSLRDYLLAFQNIYDAPMTSYEQSFIDCCRFTTPMFTKRGLEVKGRLYKLLAPHIPGGAYSLSNVLNLHDKNFENTAPFTEDQDNFKNDDDTKGRSFDAFEVDCLATVISRLQRSWGTSCWLVKSLRHHLRIDKRFRDHAYVKPSERYVLNMMAGLVQAVMAGHSLRLARLANEADTCPPTAIFVEPKDPRMTHRKGMYPKNDEAGSPSFVFASFKQRSKRGGRDCYTSLSVGVEAGNKSETILDSYGWVNGVWDIGAPQTEAFIYPIPGLTDWHMETTLQKKRKREDEHDSEQR
ncbi:hypothetical protein T440DRAFT_465757 [Plenodomus tracheiphilus IPT5]|uniref:Heterokaryon incompatibility domain-containing protein n=1 Tax=Plenodomus tracheiphilus IPT5 TaxID=1408161 RepID=A0A6A7BFA1_9PLEO|nr:hypothetical protein T440DRAFT_465757 [Plenodomus tracheiphilus IPT5]